MTFSPPENPARGTQTYRTSPVGPAPYSLLTVTADLPTPPGAALAEDGLPRISIRRDHGRCVQSVALENCPDPADPLGPAPADVQHPFYPFSWSVPVGCDNSHPDYPRLAALAQQDVEAATAWEVSHQLWTGDANAGTSTDSPSLRTAAFDLTDGTDAMNPRDAWSLLLDAYHACSKAGGGALVHVPYSVAGYLRDHQIVTPAGAVMVGATGERVSFGPGYDGNVGPDGTTTADGEAWLYISGPIDLRVGATLDPADPTGAGGIPEGIANPRLNENSVIRTRRAIFAFDLCCVFAARVVVPNDAITGS